MGRLWSWFGCAVVALACGGSPVKPKPKATVDVASARPIAEPGEALTRHSASDSLRRHWVLGDKAQIALYADLEGLAKTELFRGLLSAVLSAPGVALTPAHDACVHDLLEGARELALGLRDDDHLAILRFEPSAFRASPTACLATVIDLERASVSGAAEAYTHDHNVVALEPGLLLLGSPETVEQALGQNAPGQWPSVLDLAPDQYMTVKIDAALDSGVGGLTVTPELFRFDFRQELADVESATKGEEAVRKSLRFSPENELTPLAQLARKIRVERQGRRVLISFELAGTAAQQVEQLGKTAALAVATVRDAIIKAKTSQARRTLLLIGFHYFQAWQAGPAKLPGKGKLFSLPAVPKQIPSGTKYRSTEDDWKTWGPIGFRASEPQYYQYEVIAAKDGASAQIVARGDLDGDGKASLFTLPLTLPGGELEVGSDISETDPDE